MTSSINDEEIQARSLGQLLREAAADELAQLDAGPKLDAGVPPTASGTDVVTSLWGSSERLMREEGGALSEEDRAWMENAQARLSRSLRSRMPSEAVISALAKAQADAPLRKGSSRGVWVGVAGLAAAAAVAFFVASNIPDDDGAITFTVSGASSSSLKTGRVVAPLSRERTLSFSDGSTLKLEPAGSLRVRQTDAQGAEVVVERGRLTSQVTHREGTSWSVFAGPYEIQVVGTQFTTEWDPIKQRLEVLLDEGAVRVVGADIEDHVSLKAGQRLIATPSDTWSVNSRAVASDEVASTQQELGAQEPAVQRATSSRTAKPATSLVWGKLLAEGQFSRIMEEAQGIGLSKCISSCSISRLRSLADAARYTGDFATAERALLSLRARSPREAVRAGYLLGSLNEARGQTAGSLEWYVGYLREAPTGAFAAEALAGKMRAEHALGRKADAKSTASEYLRRHPSGASAATARRILNKK